MWKCEICNYRNNNSSERCHGKNCNSDSPKNRHAQEQKYINLGVELQKEGIKKIYDYCESCRKDMFFYQTKWKGKKGYWRCESGKHRPCFLTGKSKPFPTEVIT